MFNKDKEDVVWFTYTHELESLRVKREFLGELISCFPNVSFIDISNDTHGHGLQITNITLLGEADYYAWVIAHSYYTHSTAVTIMMTQEDQRQYQHCTALAREQYPWKWRN